MIPKFPTTRSMVVGLVGLIIAVGMTPTAFCKSPEALFIKHSGARDAVYDSKAKRLYYITDKEMVIFDADKIKEEKRLPLEGKPACIDLSSRGKSIAVGPEELQQIYWIDAARLKVEKIPYEPSPGESGVYDLAVSKSNNVLFSTVLANGTGWCPLRLCQAARKKIVNVGKLTRDTTFVANGSRSTAGVALGMRGSLGYIGFFDFRRNKIIPPPDKQYRTDRPNFAIAISPKGNYLAKSSEEMISFYDTAGKKLAEEESPKENPTIALAFHPKKDLLYMVRDKDPTVRVYDVKKKETSEVSNLLKAKIVDQDDPSSKIHGTTGGSPFVKDGVAVPSIKPYFQSVRMSVSSGTPFITLCFGDGVYLIPVD